MATMTTSRSSFETPAQAPEPAPIELDTLTHIYGARRALDSLSFSVQPAEIFGLLGPNGSGKTTLFRILSTLMVPSAGSARICGFDVAREPNRVRQQIGIVFQARSVDIKLTVAENLMHQGHLYGLRGAFLKQRIDEVLGRVLLRDRAKDAVETLSGGMQRRVELAKGLIHSPSVLLLDEPSTGLDPGARRDLWQYLRTLRDEEGVSVLVTTHLMEEAEHCDRLAILNAGKLVALGSPAELKSQIGGDVVLLEAASEAEAAVLAERVAQRFFVAPSVHGATVRLEHPQGHRFVTEVVEAFPGDIEGISVAKPSLEDVFIQRTGHRFWTETGPEAEPDAVTRAANSIPSTYKEPL
jgi:ABC-2 type transport system ATP-binding protein